MNLPASYRHDYEPPRPAPVYDTPRIVERHPLRDTLRAWLRGLRAAGIPGGREAGAAPSGCEGGTLARWHRPGLSPLCSSAAASCSTAGSRPSSRRADTT